MNSLGPIYHIYIIYLHVHIYSKLKTTTQQHLYEIKKRLRFTVPTTSNLGIFQQQGCNT